MPRPFFLFIVIACLAVSCARRDARPAAIRDFRPSLRPALVAAVATSIVSTDTATSFIRAHATDDELKLLSRCEHPLLRAIALREMTRRPTFDHMKVMMEHLDDTALVMVDHGEFGAYFRMVSDVMIERGKWKTERDRLTLIDELLRHHNTLRSAFTGLDHIDTPEKYYSFIKQMALRDRRKIDEIEMGFDEREFALYALAKCKRAEDIPLIKNIMLENTYRLSGASFGIMRDCPDSAYMEVMKKYFRYHLYRVICSERSTYRAEAFISALGAYHNDTSAQMLQMILDRKPPVPCDEKAVTFRATLMQTIRDNPCPAFAGLRKKVQWYFDEQAAIARREIPQPFDVDTTNYSKDPEPVWW